MMEPGTGYLSGAALERYRSHDSRRYSVWVYDNDEIIRVYLDERPNTHEIWFEFNEFNRSYWKKFEEECIVTYGSDSTFYSSVLMRRFMMTYMLAATSSPGIERVEHDADGRATQEAWDRLVRIHPRIWEALFLKVEIFPETFDGEKEEADLEKQAKALFCDHKGVKSPHEWIELYCNLTAFWDKFGLNYFDVMRLPNSLYVALRKVMQLDNTYTELSFTQDRAKIHNSAPRMPARMPARAPRR